MAQEILKTGDYNRLDRWIMDSRAGRVFLVCGSSLGLLPLDGYFRSLQEKRKITVTRFSSFQPNPLYGSVTEGVKKFRESGADSIIAVGGGSAMDVAKCIRVFSGMDDSRNYLEQEPAPGCARFLAVPTTAGSGSEATRYAVIYYEGEKKSVTHEACRPDAVFMDPGLLRTLPDYVKKSAAMDAFCHAVESFWSVNSTGESRGYSAEALKLLMENAGRYIAGAGNAGEKMLTASHLAGRAIDLAQTTAGHAMCYKLTGLYGISHGHSAALCVKELWPWMIGNTDKCADARGRAYLDAVFEELAGIMGCCTALSAAYKFGDIFDSFKFSLPGAEKADLRALCISVNGERLKNNPVVLSREDIFGLYKRILGNK